MNKPKYTTEECLQEYYNSLEEKLKEKDAMIDWLAKRLFLYSQFYYPEQWKNLAKDAVKYEKALQKAMEE